MVIYILQILLLILGDTFASQFYGKKNPFYDSELSKISMSDKTNCSETLGLTLYIDLPKIYHGMFFSYITHYSDKDKKKSNPH
jgi:hypothetical protein